MLGSLGLAGFLPLDVNNVALAFSDDAQGYTDFTDFTLNVDGFFDLGLIESVLPFEPILSIGPTPAGDVANPHTFTDIEFGFDLVEQRIMPINLSDIRVGFQEWSIGELVFAGEFVAGRLHQADSSTPRSQARSASTLIRRTIACSPRVAPDSTSTVPSST